MAAMPSESRSSPSPPSPVSLLTSINATGHVHLIIGTDALAASRCARSLDVGARVVLIAGGGRGRGEECDGPVTGGESRAEANGGGEPSASIVENGDVGPCHSPAPQPITQKHILSPALRKRVDDGDVKCLWRDFYDRDLFSLGRAEIDGVVDAVFVTGNVDDHVCKHDRSLPCQIRIPDSKLTTERGLHVSKLCARHRIPVNVVDTPDLCTFSLVSTYVDGPLQIGVTTNGNGCKLASRIRREIVAGLPMGLGDACRRLGRLRRRIRHEDMTKVPERHPRNENDGEDEGGEVASTFNKIVDGADVETRKTRRVRWLSQICEYWPLSRLAGVSEADLETMLRLYADTPVTDRGDAPPTDRSNRGRIILAGSGPGHPDLLTRATHKAIQVADIVLADKLVPEGVLDLIPRRTPVHIARKFPGNADRAQDELLATGLGALQQGKTVLRLKQGDPYIYGRGGEEFAYFHAHGFGDRVTVIPGITSALSAPLFAGIPSTQRAVSDQVLICTGTGRKGKPTVPPEFVHTRTVVFLMALHRLADLVADLTTWDSCDAKVLSDDGSINESRALWPRSTPCAVVERASCPDQRVIRTTLEHVVTATDVEGSRPPGLLVLGAACEVLHKSETKDLWTIEEGFRNLDGLNVANLTAFPESVDPKTAERIIEARDGGVRCPVAR